jgi:hypothetical protein
MHRDERGLVDGEEILVLVQDRDLHLGRLLVPRLPPEQDALLGLHPVAAAQAPRVGRVGAALDDRRGAGPARALELRLDEAVDPHPGGLGRDPEDRHDGPLRDVRRADDLRAAAERAGRAGELPRADPGHLCRDR